MSLENDRPDSFMGMILAFEGVSDGYTIIHGPTGCKYYPASVAESRFPLRNGEARNMFRFSGKYFFSQPRVPCTYMDMGRFVTGGSERLKDLYSKVESASPGIIAVMNSPGASLIGEDLEAVDGDIPTVHVDHAEYSGCCADGFQDGILRILETLEPIRNGHRKGVNLLGLGLMHLNWQDTAEDLRDLLSLCGVEVNCVIGAGWSTADIRNSAGAELNVLVYPEYGDRVAEYYRDKYGIPFVDAGLPLGFDALEEWVKKVCFKVKADPSPALALIHDGRMKSVKALKQMEAYHMLPKGHTFSMFCDGSLALAATEFLYGYLGMVPVAVRCPSGEKYQERTEDFIRDRGIPCSDDPLHTDSDVLLSSGTIGISCLSRGLVRGYVEMEAPGTKYVNVRSEAPIGMEGTLRLVDGVLNIIASRQRFV